jgi:hypothetical protein
MKAVEEGESDRSWAMSKSLTCGRKGMDIIVKRKVFKVLMKLLADERMARHQHLRFKLSTDASDDQVFGGDANGSVDH